MTSEDTLVEAESHGLIATSGDEVRLAHPLYGETVRATLAAAPGPEPPAGARGRRRGPERRSARTMPCAPRGSGSTPGWRCRQASRSRRRARRTAPATRTSAPSSRNSRVPTPTSPPRCSWPSHTRCATATSRRRRRWRRSSRSPRATRTLATTSDSGCGCITGGCGDTEETGALLDRARAWSEEPELAAVHIADPPHLRRTRRRVRDAARSPPRAPPTRAAPIRPGAGSRRCRRCRRSWPGGATPRRRRRSPPGRRCPCATTPMRPRSAC